ncbi:MAG: nucleotide exchange factor GrpE [Gammaproteobacteria bacterium]|nr:nucleotide exchange factor GrpE [Gammaproteobacteria bacterium]
MSNEKETAVENSVDEAPVETPVEVEVEVNDAADGEAPEQSHEELLLTLQDAQAKADEHWNQLLMARADLSNAQRRAERDLANAHKFGVEKLALELIPIKDSMEMGLAAVAEGDEQDEGRTKVIEGMELTLQMFSGVLDKFGVKEVNPQGDKFNPDFHQAMSMQETADVAPNTVINVFQKGYVLNERLIRPAMVVVSKAVAE